jgi:hypothetical protein
MPRCKLPRFGFELIQGQRRPIPFEDVIEVRFRPAH